MTSSPTAREPAIEHAPVHTGPMVSERQADLLLGVVLLLLGAATIYGSMGLAYTGRGGTGPGFLPRWLGIGLALAGAALVVSRLRMRGAGMHGAAIELPDRVGTGRVVGTMALLFGLALLFEPLGFLAAAALVVFVLLFALERQPAVRALLVAVLFAVFSYLLFGVWLGLRLPAGILGMLGR